MLVSRLKTKGLTMNTLYSEQNKTARITHSFAVANTELCVSFEYNQVSVSVWFGHSEYVLFSSPCELKNFANALDWALNNFTDNFIMNIFNSLELL